MATTDLARLAGAPTAGTQPDASDAALVPAARPPAGPAAHRPAQRPGLRIAMVGQKGLPATFGGVERHVEEVGAWLADRGHDVTVYCRNSYGRNGQREYRGMRLRRVPTIGTKHLDAIVHSAFSTVAAITNGADIVHYHALGPGLVAPVPRYLSTASVVLTVHGLDNERGKWSPPARAVLGAAHWMSARVPDETVVVSHALAEHYEAFGARRVTHIVNGVSVPRLRRAQQITAEFALGAGTYVLFVGRLVPEKAPDLLLRAFARLRTGLRLVITGDSAFTDRYATELRRLGAADPRVVFTGYAYGDLLAELYSNAAAFVLPSHLEGMPLTLLEAASYGVPIVASDIAPHVEVLGRNAPGRRLFRAGDEEGLRAALSETLQDAAAAHIGAVRLRDEVRRTYRWDEAARQLEAVYFRAVAERRRNGVLIEEVRGL